MGTKEEKHVLRNLTSSLHVLGFFFPQFGMNHCLATNRRREELGFIHESRPSRVSKKLRLKYLCGGEKSSFLLDFRLIH